MNAFEKWFQIEFKDKPAMGAAYLFHCCADGPADSVAWGYLEQTGDKTYTADSFLKAAMIILEPPTPSDEMRSELRETVNELNKINGLSR